MRIAVVHFGNQKILPCARGLSRGIGRQNHHVDIIDGILDVQTRLTSYTYIAVGVDALSAWSSRVNTHVAEFLSAAGMIAGKKTCAFISKKFIGGQKLLSRLMSTLEHEGMFIRYSAILRSEAEGEVVGSRLKL